MTHLVLENMPWVSAVHLAQAEAALEQLIELATFETGRLLCENEKDEAETLADAVNGAKHAMRMVQELTDELARASA